MIRSAQLLPRLGLATALLPALFLGSPARAQCPEDSNQGLLLSLKADTEDRAVGEPAYLDLVLVGDLRSLPAATLQATPATTGVRFGELRFLWGEFDGGSEADATDCGFARTVEEGSSLQEPGGLALAESSFGPHCELRLETYLIQRESTVQLRLTPTDDPTLCLETPPLQLRAGPRSPYTPYGCSSAGNGSGSLALAFLGLLLLWPGVAPSRIRSSRRSRLSSLLLAGTLALPGAALAQEPEAPETPLPRLVFPGLENADALPAPVLPALEGAIEAHLSSLQRYRITSRQQVQDLLDLEAQRQLLGCQAESCGPDLSEALDADRMLNGRITRSGESLFVDLRLTDLRSLTSVAARQTRVREDWPLEDLVEAILPLIDELVESDPLAANGPQAPPSRRARPSPAHTRPAASPLGPNLFRVGLGLVTDAQRGGANAIALRATLGLPRLAGVADLIVTPSDGHGAEKIAVREDGSLDGGAVGFTSIGARLGLQGGWVFADRFTLFAEAGLVLFWPALGFHLGLGARYEWEALWVEITFAGEAFPAGLRALGVSDAGLKQVWTDALVGSAAPAMIAVGYRFDWGRRSRRGSRKTRKPASP